MVYRLKIFRFNPALDNVPKYCFYTIESDYRPTILLALRKIRDEDDETLAFRESCGLGKCGSCALRKNGQPVLACQTFLDEEENLIEPLANSEIVKDLVVDRTEFNDRLLVKRVFYSHPDYIKANKREAVEWSDSFKELTNCIQCQICESACPVFNHNKSDFPGPLILGLLARLNNHPLNSGNEEYIAWIDGIHNCTACMTCQEVCPQEVDVFRNGILSLRSTIVDKNLALPRTQEALTKLYVKTGKSLPASNMKLEHQFEHRAINSQSKTALFLGCTFSDRYPQAGKKILDLLSACNIEVQVPEGFVCCGAPLLWIGQKKRFEEAFRINIRIFEESNIKQVITPCPGCALTLKKDYGDSYKNQTGKEIPFTIFDMTEILALKVSNLKFEDERPLKVAYHSPCHQGKGQGLLNKSMAILKANPMIELYEMEAIDECCGGMSSSSNRVMMFEMSMKIIEKAEDSGADTLVTNCLFCYDNLNMARKQMRTSIEVEHLLMLIAGCLVM